MYTTLARWAFVLVVWCLATGFTATALMCADNILYPTIVRVWGATLFGLGALLTMVVGIVSMNQWDIELDKS